MPEVAERLDWKEETKKRIFIKTKRDLGKKETMLGRIFLTSDTIQRGSVPLRDCELGVSRVFSRFRKGQNP